MTQSVTTLGCFALLALTIGCEFHARSPEDYRDATQALLESNSAPMEQCYTSALQQNPNLAGQVMVNFTVQAETGRVADVQVAEGSDPTLGDCVTQALTGLALTPPDERNGLATWTFEFQPRPAPAVTAEPVPAEPAPG
jgi:hypothetical protein